MFDDRYRQIPPANISTLIENVHPDVCRLETQEEPEIDGLIQSEVDNPSDVVDCYRLHNNPDPVLMASMPTRILMVLSVMLFLHMMMLQHL